MRDDILFVTTTINTKWILKQSQLIKNSFPDCPHIIVDGTKNWPYSWFYWLSPAAKSDRKYYIHLDEDFFLENPEEINRCIEKIEREDIDLLGCSDGYHHYRDHNPVAINTFFMLGKVEHLQGIYDFFTGMEIFWNGDSFVNSFDLHYKEEYSKDFNYQHEIMGGYKYDNFEPYYAFMWKMKDMGLKFDYLYPHFDERFKSTNPRIDKNSCRYRYTYVVY
jgi:hypothetical protein